MSCSAGAALLLTDSDPKQGSRKELFSQEAREKTAQLLGRAISRHRGRGKTSSGRDFDRSDLISDFGILKTSQSPIISSKPFSLLV